MAQGNPRCVALYDYQARDTEELSIAKNEQLTVLEAAGQWWKVRSDRGGVGLVPSNYVKEMPLITKSGRSAAADEPGMYQQTDLVVHNGPPPLNIRCVVKHRYASTREDELSLEKGAEVIVLEKEEDGWWRGRCGPNIGWFPFNYVEEMKEMPQPVMHVPLPAKEKQYICSVVALYHFNSGNAEELAFQKGDMMDIIDQPTDDPDWWEARKADGKTGLIPRNYVEVINDAQPKVGMPPATGVGAPAMMTSAAANLAPAPVFAREPWYHGRVPRKEAESLLMYHANNGQFLVRASETKPGDYSISMKAPDRIKHFNVKKLPDGRFGIGQRKFDSMDELFEHYRRAPIYTSTAEGKIYLSTPFTKR